MLHCEGLGVNIDDVLLFFTNVSANWWVVRSGRRDMGVDIKQLETEKIQFILHKIGFVSDSFTCYTIKGVSKN